MSSNAFHRRAALRLGLAVVLLAALGPGGTPARAETGKVVEIGIDNFTFTPADVTIDKGTTVRWVNRDDIPHAIAEKGQAFHSAALDTGDAYTHVFADAGEVTYFCTLHPHMTGRIVVR
jgi:plastocyanin